MSFLNPWFLLGSLALAIPVLIHLVRREKTEIIPFSSLMFLLRVPRRAIRQQKLKNLLLMVLRLLILALLVFAFARPYLTKSPAQAATSERNRGMVLLLDTSYSMRYANHFERLKDEARKRIDGLRPGDRAALIAFNEKATVVSMPSGDKDSLKAAVAALEPSYARTSYYEAFALADRMFGQLQGGEKQLVMVSDFQKNGWGRSSRESILGTDVKAELIDVGAENSANIGIDSVSVDATTFSRTYTGRVIARINNHQPGQPAALPVALEVNGREVERKSANVPPKSTELVEFTGFDLPIGFSRGRIRVDAKDPLSVDNEFLFALERRERLNVLILDAGRARPSFFLRQAFTSSAELPFEVKIVQAGNVSLDEMAKYEVIIINDVPRLADRAKERLDELRKIGQGQLIILGEAADAGWWNNFPALPVRIVARIFVAKDRGQPFYSLTSYDRNHNIFRPFEESTKLTLNTAQFFAYLETEAKPGAGVIAKFENGAPAIVESVSGEQGLLVFTSTVDNRWNDLPLKPSFLPLFHEMIRHLARYREGRGWFQLGEAVPVVGGPQNVVAAVIRPGGERQTLGEVPAGERKFFTPETPGFYEVRVERESQIVGVNPPSAEGHLEKMPPEDLLASVQRTQGEGQRTPTFSLEEEGDHARRQMGWWYLLLFALILGVIEVSLANRWYSKASET